ncbi:PaaI family thioesterase [Urechidicola vernalis]|uniref:PaaI family thioesterase n=1 Tax=Urechidicola vernalis TaxID=3075600 RepID=A0ABU2Y455_9FLAO|nr:PaaI family thioesterase [Urechidicola sp. P050]MDT0552497.1 PaaI family thioesterase [Urechidicola sp. P050]
MDVKKTLDHINNQVFKNTLMTTLEIEVVEIGKDYVVATMPVNSKVYQPDALLHGGATVALAETVGSLASHVSVDLEKYYVKGLEITANHLKSVKNGLVTATAKPIHKGKTTHLWEVKVENDQGDLISLVKLTTIVLPKKK